jgi:hypothetical protein
MNYKEPAGKIFNLKLPSGLDPETIATDRLLGADPEHMSDFAQIVFLRFVEYLKLLACQASRISSETEQRLISEPGSRIIIGFAAHRAPVP